ncbi:MAG: hypothetical protein Q8L73_06685 [Methylotenera sp.]|nr:hypothetical protein [Methylotenera sp.]
MATIVVLLSIAITYVFWQAVYKPYIWNKAIVINEHKLVMGSFIFSKERGVSGSQSPVTNYLVL